MLKEKIKSFFAICILIVTIPYVVTFFFQRNETNPEPGTFPENIQEPAAEIPETEPSKEGAPGQDPAQQETGTPALDTDSQTPDTDTQTPDTGTEGSGASQTAGKLDMDIEEYLAGVVAKQIPLDYQPEAIKAQAVIARTSLAAALGTEGMELPSSMSREEMLTLWGQDGFEKNYHVLEEAILDTQGEILTYGGEPILTSFHAVSAGKTRNAPDASIENAPYLCSVDSSWDIPSPDFLHVTFLEQEDFLKKLQQACPELDVPPDKAMEAFTIEARDSNGYVTQAKAGKTPLSGESARECLGLDSACFYIKEVEGQIRIVTKGLGHGLGLSQFAANEMAKEGMEYREILQYFYTDTELVPYPIHN